MKGGVKRLVLIGVVVASGFGFAIAKYVAKQIDRAVATIGGSSAV